MKTRASSSKTLAIILPNEPKKGNLAIEASNPIFKLTGVTYPENIEKDVTTLPRMSDKLSKSITTPLLPKTSEFKKKPLPTTTPKLVRHLSNLNWGDFLKSIFYSGNIVPPSKPSENLQEKINEVDTRIDSEINSTQDTIFMKSIKKLDRSANVEGQLNEISAFTLAKKEFFNDIHEEYMTKLEKLGNLRKTLNELEACDIESKEIERELLNKKNDLAKTRKDLAFETFYSETLKFLLRRSRDLVKKAAIPINGKNEDIFRINLDIKKDKRDIKQAYFEAKQLKKKIKKMKQEIFSEKEEKTQILNYKLKIYEDQQRLKKCIAIEQKRHEIYEKNRLNTRKLQDFELQIAELKQEKLIDKELTKLNRHLENQERKFRAIQRVTNSSNIEDVLPYYIYLQNNRENLQKTMNDSLEMIARLTKERAKLQETYKSLLLQSEEQVLQERRLGALKKESNYKEEKLEKKGFEIEKLDTLVLSAITILGRLIFQLGDEKPFEVNENNLTYCLGFCCIKIDKIMEVIQAHQNVYYIESVNTDMQCKHPPEFLKLNTVIQLLWKANETD